MVMIPSSVESWITWIVCSAIGAALMLGFLKNKKKLLTTKAAIIALTTLGGLSYFIHDMAKIPISILLFLFMCDSAMGWFGVLFNDSSNRRGAADSSDTWVGASSVSSTDNAHHGSCYGSDGGSDAGGGGCDPG
jgi:uncharacterized membrane protein